MDLMQMGLMASALARLGCRPDISWLEECLGVSRKALPLASAGHLVQLIEALAALRFRPGNGWMQVSGWGGGVDCGGVARHGSRPLDAAWLGRWLHAHACLHSGPKEPDLMLVTMRKAAHA